MGAGARVLARVFVGRRVAAQRDAARLARPQMDPPGSDLHALVAFESPRVLHALDPDDVGTRAAHQDSLRSSSARRQCARSAAASYVLLRNVVSVASGDGVARTASYGRMKIEKRSEEHTSELQSRVDLVCRLLLEKKKTEKLLRHN